MVASSPWCSLAFRCVTLVSALVTWHPPYVCLSLCVPVSLPLWGHQSLDWSLPWLIEYVVVIFHSLSQVQLFATPWTAACQALLYFTFFLEFAQIHVHWVGDAIYPFHPLSPPSLAFIFPSIRVFSSELALCIRWPTYWSFSFSISPFNEYSGLISFSIDLVWSCSPRDSQESSPAPQFKSIHSSALSLLYGCTLI